MLLRDRSSRSTRRAAFTLMEMMVVVAIIVVLGGIAVVAYTNFGDRGNEAKAVQDIKNIDLAVMEYYMETGMKAFPQSLEELTVPNVYGKVLLKREALLDPWGNPYVYDPSGQMNSQAGELKPDIYCDRGTYVLCNWASGKITK